jgi:hypothetical protein
MPREGERRKPRIYRDMCAALDVVALVERGFLAGGFRAGELELLGMGGLDWCPRVAVRALVGPEVGSLHVATSFDQAIELVLVATGTGRAWWRLVCPRCRRKARRLYLPPIPAAMPTVEVGFECRVCWDLAYRSPRRVRLASVRERFAELRSSYAELAWLEGIAALDLADLAEEGRRAARDRRPPEPPPDAR